MHTRTRQLSLWAHLTTFLTRVVSVPVLASAASSTSCAVGRAIKPPSVHQALQPFPLDSWPYACSRGVRRALAGVSPAQRFQLQDTSAHEGHSLCGTNPTCKTNRQEPGFPRTIPKSCYSYVKPKNVLVVAAQPPAMPLNHRGRHWRPTRDIDH